MLASICRFAECADMPSAAFTYCSAIFPARSIASIYGFWASAAAFLPSGSNVFCSSSPSFFPLFFAASSSSFISFLASSLITDRAASRAASRADSAISSASSSTLYASRALSDALSTLPFTGSTAFSEPRVTFRISPCFSMASVDNLSTFFASACARDAMVGPLAVIFIQSGSLAGSPWSRNRPCARVATCWTTATCFGACTGWRGTFGASTAALDMRYWWDRRAVGSPQEAPFRYEAGAQPS
mmetsp:Transcript_74511/g.198752  ORF Transcript_74511/g.198752 Transcript_74511/m.198752 type:complete len:243 (-) Transcript_74511:343-1071(-)